MEKRMAQSSNRCRRFAAAMAFVALLCTSFHARAQYESFFGQESWEYATAYHPITKSTADYDPYLLYCLTDIYHFTSSDTVTIEGKVYYNFLFSTPPSTTLYPPVFLLPTYSMRPSFLSCARMRLTVASGIFNFSPTSVALQFS